MRSKSDAGMRRMSRMLLLAGVTLLGVGAEAQVIKAPKYQSNVEAPTPQLSLPPLPKAITPNGTVVEDVVVRVNDQIISRSDVERSDQQMLQDAQHNNAGPADITAAEKNLLRDMIDQQLLLSRAKELGLNADADVIRQMDDIRKKNNIPSMEDLEIAIKSQGLNIDDFKAQIRNQILTQQVVRDEVGRRLQLTQAEEAKYYEAHRADFQQVEQVDLSEILVPLPENATPAEIAQADKKAGGLRAELTQGADFAALAKKQSGGPTAAQGGELGLFKRGQLAKVLEDQTFALSAGEITQPIRTRQGFVLLKVMKHDQAGAAPMATVEPQIQEAIYMQQMQPALRAYLSKLRDAAYIDIQPGFVDAGATPNETKPVFTTYTPPPTKKKVVKKTVRFDRNGRGTYAPSSAAASPKPAVVASPDTTGTRTLTGSEAAPLIDPKTGLAMIPGVTSNPATSKPKHLKREKIRFGQAPRESLAGNQAGTDPNAPTAIQPGNPGPGASLIQQGGTVAAGQAQEAAAVQAAAESPAPAPVAKTRFAAKAPEVHARKVQATTAKAEEKAIATPTAASSEEKASATQQAAPLGLAGDTTKKPKKPKRQKGAPKQRLEDKPVDTKPTAAPVDPTASPSLAPTSTTPPSTKTPPSAATPGNSSQARPASSTPDATTLPPVTTPPPGTGPQGQPVPGTAPPQ